MIINVEGVGPVNFDDSLSQDQINDTIQNQIWPAHGIEPPEPPGFVDALSAGTDILQGALYSTVEGVGEATGLKGLATYGREGAERNRAEARAAMPSQQDIYEADAPSEYWRWFQQTLGTSLPISAPMITAGAFGGKVGAAIGGPFAPVTALGGAAFGMGLGALVGTPVYYGLLREAQKEEHGEVQSEGIALMTAPFIGAMDALLGRWLPFGASQKIASNLVLKGMGAGLTEAPTEMAQQIAERWSVAASKPGATYESIIADLTSDEAIKEYGAAAAGGFVVGGTIGATVSPFTRKRPELPPPEIRPEVTRMVATPTASLEEPPVVDPEAPLQLTADPRTQFTVEGEMARRAREDVGLAAAGAALPEEETADLVQASQEATTILGTFNVSDLTSRVAGIVTEQASRRGQVGKEDFTIGEIKAAGATFAEIQDLVARRRPLVGDAAPTIEDIEGIAATKNINIRGASQRFSDRFRDFTEQTVGSRNIASLKPEQRAVLAEAISRYDPVSEPINLPFVTGPSYSVRSYEDARDRAIESGKLSIGDVIRVTGLPKDTAAELHADLVKRGEIVQKGKANIFLRRPQTYRDFRDVVPPPVEGDEEPLLHPDEDVALREYRVDQRPVRGKRPVHTVTAVAQGPVTEPEAGMGVLAKEPIAQFDTQEEAEAAAERMRAGKPGLTPRQLRDVAEPPPPPAEAPRRRRSPIPADQQERVTQQLMPKLEQQAVKRGLQRLGLPVKLVGNVEEYLGEPVPTEGVTEGARTHDENMRRVILLAMDAVPSNLTTDEEILNYLAGVLDHELVHALIDAGAITPEQWDTLYKAARDIKVPGDPDGFTFLQRAQADYDPQMVNATVADELIRRLGREPSGREINDAIRQYYGEEAIAQMFRHYASDPTSIVEPKVVGIIENIIEVLKRIVRSFRDAGYQSAQDIMADIQSGAVVERKEFADSNARRDAIEADRLSRRAPGIRYSNRNTGTPEFKRWFKDSKIIGEDGKPLILFHGTTWDIESFSPQRTHIEGDLGGGFYFTDSLYDAETNYAAEDGPDLTIRMGMLQEQYINDIEQDPEEFGLTADADSDLISDMAATMARAELVGDGSNVVEAYLSIQNPVIITQTSDEGTYFELEQKQEGEGEGSLIDFTNALREAGEELMDTPFFDNYQLDINQVVADIMEASGYDRISARSLMRFAKESSGLMYAEVYDDRSGRAMLASSEVLRRSFELMGFDGIVDKSVYFKFGAGRGIGSGMQGLYRDTTHYLAFTPTQIKSTENRGSFDPEDVRIRYSIRAPAAEPTLGVGSSAGNKHGFGRDLRVGSGVSSELLPEKPAFTQATTNRNASEQVQRIDDILAQHPNAHTSPEAWNEMMAVALADPDVPVPPYAFIRDINSNAVIQRLSNLTPGQVADADHGFANAAAFRQAYTSGQLDIETTGKLFLWSFLSRGVSPYTQESLFIDAFNSMGPWMRAAAAGDFNLEEYLAWSRTVAPRGSGQPGAGAAHNLNGFGRDFLVKMSRPVAEGSDKSRLQHLHDLMSDPNATGQQIRREFATFGEGVGIDNKVVSFTLLVAGFNDVMVIDRVQMRQLWDDGRFRANRINLYDGRKNERNQTITGTSLSNLVSGVRGIFIYEAIERAIAANINRIYSGVGRPQNASIGRYHWETWVADSEQEAAHGSIGAILPDATGDEEAIHKVTAKQGEYGSYAYGARYGVTGEGIPYIQYGLPSGKMFTFTLPNFVEFQNIVRQPDRGVVPEGFSVTKSGNAPWYEREEVNDRQLERLVARYAEGPTGSRAGTFLRDGKDEDVSDRPSAAPIEAEQTAVSEAIEDAWLARVQRDLGTRFSVRPADVSRTPELDAQVMASPTVRRVITSPEFQNWLGRDFYMRDENGLPVVIYHATNSAEDFEAFDPSRHSTNASFFTPKSDFANAFLGKTNFESKYYKKAEARGAPLLPRIIPVFTNIRNPFDPTLESHVDNVWNWIKEHEQTAEFKEKLESNKAALVEKYADPNDPNLYVPSIDMQVMDPLGLPLIPEDMEDMRNGDWESIEDPRIQQAIRALGYDSFHMYEFDTKNLGVFEPTTIKSVANSGSWDPMEPNIRLSRRIFKGVSKPDAPIKKDPFRGGPKELQRYAIKVSVQNPETGRFDAITRYIYAESDGHAWELASRSPYVMRDTTEILSVKSEPRKDRYSVRNPPGWRGPHANAHTGLQAEGLYVRNRTEGYFAKYLRNDKPIKVPGIDKEFSIVDARIKLQDKMLMLGMFEDQILNRGGVLNDNMRAYMIEQLEHGKTVANIETRENSLYIPLFQAISQSSVSLEELERYLLAYHAEERNASILANMRPAMRERTLAEGKPPSGMSDQEARQVLQDVAASPKSREYNRLRELVQAIIQNTTDTRLAGHLIDEEMIAGGMKTYMPLKGGYDEEFDATNGTPQELEENKRFVPMRKGRGNVRGKEDRSPVGRRTIPTDIVGHAIMQNQEAVIRSNRNEILRAFGEAVRANKDRMGDYAWELTKYPMRKVKTNNGVIQLRPDPSAPSNPKFVIYKEINPDTNKVRQVYIETADPRLAASMNGLLSPDQVGALTQAMGKFSRFLANVNTSWNPEFLLSNFPRDLETAAVVAAQFDLPGLEKQILKGVPSALRGIEMVLRKDKASITGALGLKVGRRAEEFSDEFNLLKSLGGTTEFMGIQDLNQTLKRIAELAVSDPQTGPLSKGRKMFENMFHAIEDYNKIIENGVRLSTFTALRKQHDVSDQQAAMVAKNLTVNFTKGGTAKATANSWYLFYNVAIQGSWVLMNAMRTPRVRKIAAGIVAAGFMQDQINSLLSGDEDDDLRNDYDEIDVWNKEHNIILIDPTGLLGTPIKNADGTTAPGHYIRIPAAWGFNAIYNMGRALSSQLRGADTLANNTSSAFFGFVDAFNPLGGTSSFYNMASPTILDPVFDLVANKDFAKKPIAPVRISTGTRPTEPSSQVYWANTNPAFVSVAQWINKIGGNEFKPGMFDFSPNQYEYVFDYLLGGAGAFTLRTLTPLVRAGKGLAEEGTITSVANLFSDSDQIDTNQVSLVRKFIGTVGNVQDRRQFYDNASVVLRAQAELDGFRKAGNWEEVKRVQKDYAPLLMIAPFVKKAERDLSKERKRLKEIRANPDLKDKMKKQLIKQIQTRQDFIIDQVNRMYNQFVRGGG